jgi:hypothetical protein
MINVGWQMFGISFPESKFSAELPTTRIIRATPAIPSDVGDFLAPGSADDG